MKKNGFTIIEVLVALVIFAVVSGSIYQILIQNERTYRQQAERVTINSNVRTALAILPGELRELNASDALQSDIVGMSSDFIQYKAMRNLYFLCQDPDAGPGDIFLWANPWYGTRAMDAALDSVVVFADGSESSRNDDRWVHAGARNVSTGTDCPGGAASLKIRLSSISAPGLASVRNGAPVRGYEVVQLSLYEDALGDYWLGRSSWRKGGSNWTTIEPLLGPLSATGLQFTYYDTLNVVTAVPGDVARIGVTVEGESGMVRTSSGGMGTITVDLVTSIALRNNVRF